MYHTQGVLEKINLTGKSFPASATSWKFEISFIFNSKNPKFKKSLMKGFHPMNGNGMEIIQWDRVNHQKYFVQFSALSMHWRRLQKIMMSRIWNEETHTHGFHQELFLIQLVFKKIFCQQVDWNASKKIWLRTNLPNIYLHKVNIRNTRKTCKICWKLTIKTSERHQWHHSGVFIGNFEHISYLFLMFLLMTLSK